MLICMHIWGSSLHLSPHRRSSIIIIGTRDGGGAMRGGGDAAYAAAFRGRRDPTGLPTERDFVNCDEHEHMMRPGLFLQREGPGSEPGNSLVHPDGHV